MSNDTTGGSIDKDRDQTRDEAAAGAGAATK